MKVKQLLLGLLLCNSIFSYGQKSYYNQQENYLKANSVWVFGHHAGLDFNSGSPVSFTDSIDINEGCASVADPVTGQLLFYSDGRKCWNRNNKVMPNGNNLLGNEGSTSQGVCIVPMVDSPGKYYLFSLYGPTDWPNGTPPTSGTLFYSIVDMKSDNGLGDIASAQKNILLSNDTLSEYMTAIPGNNCDIWLLIHDYRNPVFKAYQITGDGLDTIPIISNAGQQMQGNFTYVSGELSVSPDRSMIALRSYFFSMLPPYTGALLAKFNATTGIVSDAIKLTDANGYSICFSPDNSKLYTINSITSARVNLVQWDISNYDSASIVSSMQVIDSVSTNHMFIKSYNDKIYTSYYNNPSVGIINDPNLSGQACNFDSSIVSLLPNYAFSTCPNDVIFPLRDTTYQQILDTTLCGNNQTLTLEGTPGYSGYYWGDGSTNQKHTITKSGTYWVLNQDACHSRVDTFVVKIFDMIPPVISVDSFILRTATSYATYQWMLNGNIIPGATQSTYTVTQNGKYQVIASNEHGCTDTSDVYPVNNYTGIRNRTILANQIRIYPNPASELINLTAPIDVNIAICSIDGKVIKRIQKIRSISIGELAKGVYFLYVYDQNNNPLKVEKIVKIQ